MRIISWNIRHGGGTRVEKIIETLTELDPDILIIPEFRNNKNGDIIKKALSEKGLIHHFVPNTEPRINTVLISARLPFTPLTFDGEILGKWKDRVVKAEFDDLVIYGMYFPQKQEKETLFKFILQQLDLPINKNKKLLFLGDFNTGKHLIDEKGSTFYCADYIEKMEQNGLIDLWRRFHGDRREFTWFSNSGNGFRIDHAFGNEAASKSVKDCKYIHKQREDGVSDHSLMLIDMSFVCK